MELADLARGGWPRRTPPCGSAARARSSPGPAESPTSSSRPRASTSIVEHNVGDLTAVLEAGVPLARGAGEVRAGGPDARARPARPGRDDRRRRRDGRLRAAAHPLRRSARPRGGDAHRARRRHGRQERRQGDQERGGLRPRRSCSSARTGRSGRSSRCRFACTRCRRPRPAPSAARTTRTRSAARRSRCRTPGSSRWAWTCAGRTAPGAILSRFGGADRACRRPRRPSACCATPAWTRRSSRTTTRCGRRSATSQRSPAGLVVKVSALQTDLPELLRLARDHGATLAGRAGLGAPLAAARRRRPRWASSRRCAGAGRPPCWTGPPDSRSTGTARSTPAPACSPSA